MVKKTHCNKRQRDESNESGSLIPMESLSIDNKRQHTYTTSSLIPIKSIPQDFLLNVVARKTKQVSLEKFPLIPWSHKEAFDSFMQSCKEGGNIEALYRVGLQELKSFVGDIEKDMKGLKMAAEKGHLEAKYTYALILLCSHDDDLRKEGVQYLQFLRNAKCVVNCRNKVITLLEGLWRKPYGTLVRNPASLCCKKPCKSWSLKKGTWQLVDNEDDDDSIQNSCENCRWNVELDFFYDVLFYPS
ncbi:hypothetical protein PHAVU_003G180400 [Phaseolus vulgaris]|uniref:At2g35280-like TPR domain-containing protein n=1 Tax=Phaseolus vulgaris TaxID=3885 RepID=V7CE79_PHAVU|nr:hypothetical protein PHAVU_003G180400g [Phaseolus vulgaris]ESW27176.1 hypothetical protein PHAVU_003G180400g [Phaseolus vulgaris]